MNVCVSMLMLFVSLNSGGYRQYDNVYRPVRGHPISNWIAGTEAIKPRHTFLFGDVRRQRLSTLSVDMNLNT